MQIDRLEVNASWLVWLRWVAVVGQLLTVFVAAVLLGVELAWRPLLLVIGLTALTNVGLASWLWAHKRLPPLRRQQQDHRVLAAVMALDILFLTALLYFSGGPENPFAIFYFVNLALAAVVLPGRSNWSLLLLSLGCLVVLMYWHVPMPELSRVVNIGLGQQRTLQDVGLMTAVALCAVVAIYFITRVTAELQQREEQLRFAEQERARSERQEALATLAAGAGHELASPLSTIAVIAKDLTQHLEGASVPDSVIEDVRLIRSELDHCRRILDGMASSAGQATGEEMRPVTVRELIEEALSGLPSRQRISVGLDDVTATQSIVVPLMGTANSLRGLIRNALDASPPDVSVELAACCNGQTLELRVRDRGVGMSPDVLARAGEPFFSTKEPGKGMGLGLFFTKNLFQRLGGEFVLTSQPQIGTTALVRLPLANRPG